MNEPIYKVQFKSSHTFQIARFLVAPSVWKFYRLIVYLFVMLWHLDVEKLRYRAKSDSTFVVSVEKLTSNKERTSSFVLNLVKHLPKLIKKVYGDDSR